MGKEQPPTVVGEAETKGQETFKIRKEESVEVVEIKLNVKLKGEVGGEKKEGSADVVLVGVKRAFSTTHEVAKGRGR
jgi:hypothetical protein